jgi:murein L,D-transpeptidase YafK
MTEENLEAHAGHQWAGFWRDLKPAYDSFERTRLPPRIAICEQRYYVAEAEPGSKDGDKPLAILRPAGAQTASLGHGAPACIVEPQAVAQPSAASSQIQTSALPERRQSTAREKKPAASGSDQTAVRKRVAKASGESSASDKEAPARTDVPNGFGGSDRKGRSQAIVSATD